MIVGGRASLLNDHSETGRVGKWAAFLVAASLNMWLLWHLHDRYWYPTDDGLYAHVAHRLLNGEVLNLDIQDIHPGYIHFLHAVAFRIFGLDLVSLRYPLMIAAFVQACAVFFLLRRHGPVLAIFGSMAATALGVVQFVDPTSNWYSLSLCTVLACWMVWLPAGHPARLVGAGVLLGTLTMFRHLSGVWVAMAVLVLAMLERSSDGRGPSLLFARGLLLTMLTALVGYLILSPETEPGGVLLMALWPMAVLVRMLVHVRTTNADVTRLVGEIGIGVAVPVLPLLAYHVTHGSLTAWIRDNVFAASGETQMAFFGSGWYGVLPLAGLYQAASSADLVKIANGLYWAVLPLLSAINGWLVLKKLRRGESAAELALPMLACFYALVSLYLEGPLYLYYSAGLSLVSILWIAGDGGPAWRLASGTTAAALTIVALVFHAGQSRFRTPVEILEGRRVSSVWAGTGMSLPRASLRLDERDHRVYGGLVALIQRETKDDESILALPNDAELYFLADRPNPTRFYNSALGLRTERDVDDVLSELGARPPRVVIFRPDDKYNNDGSRRIMALVMSTYDRIDTMDGAEIYRLR